MRRRVNLTSVLRIGITGHAPMTGFTVSESTFSKQQMPVSEASVTNAKTSQFDISPLHWHHRQCSYDRFEIPMTGFTECSLLSNC
ncbi:hypothetical protein TNCV_53681 [Trichonephila clavipes]|nr:hypothetical protein TNCV_53681 [Trichonephila clavipes]